MAELTRHQQTIILLRSRHDWQPGIRGQFSTFGATAAEAATEWVLCRPCDGRGKIRERAKKNEPPVEKQCAKCEGEGRYQIDSYTGRRDGEITQHLFSGEERAERNAATVAQIERLKQQTAPPRSENDLIAEATPYGWEIERDKHFKAGSYRDLDAALEWLSARNSTARALVGWVYESGADTLGCLDDSILRAADLAVVLVAARMPDPIKVPHWLISVPRQGRWTKEAA